MSYLLYLGIVLSSVTQSASNKAFYKGGGTQVVFNAIKALSAVALMLIVGLFRFEFHLPTLLFGISYGILLTVAMYAGYEALRRGPMALTSMLVSFSVLIPFLWGVAVKGETLAPWQYVGILLLLLAFLATNADKLKKSASNRGSYGVWLLFVALTFAANGAGSVLQTEHQALYPGLYQKELTLLAMCVCAIVYFVWLLASVSLRRAWQTKGKGYAALSGLANACVSFLTALLAATENASVLFPVISAGSALGVLLCGRVIFREKLKINHYAALALGISAVILVKI